jgi:hypothetical protein
MVMVIKGKRKKIERVSKTIKEYVSGAETTPFPS